MPQAAAALSVTRTRHNRPLTPTGLGAYAYGMTHTEFEVWLTSPEGEDLNCWRYATQAEADARYNALATAEINTPTGNAIEMFGPDGERIDQ